MSDRFFKLEEGTWYSAKAYAEVKEENARLKAEVERLTEAGDRLCDKEFVETMGDYEFDNEAYAIRIRNWHKAKGMQP